MANKDFFSGMAAMAGLIGLGALAYFGGKKALEFAKERKYCFCDDDEYDWYGDEDDKESMTDEEIQEAAEAFVKEASRNWEGPEACDCCKDEEAPADKKDKGEKK